MIDMVFTSKETVMTKQKTAGVAGLITLGTAKVDTKGVSSIYAPDELAQKRPTPGLSAD